MMKFSCSVTANDVDMLRDVGFGVAMGNGCAKAKAAANYVTTDVDDDGIYLKRARRYLNYKQKAPQNRLVR